MGKAKFFMFTYPKMLIKIDLWIFGEHMYVLGEMGRVEGRIGHRSP